eukprot:PhF_6_TR38587/c1_g1_i1/m.57350
MTTRSGLHPRAISLVVFMLVSFFFTTTEARYINPPFFRTQLLPAMKSSQTYTIGQEIRVRLTGYYPTGAVPPRYYNVINVTAGGMSVRIIAAYASRGSTGAPVTCNSSASSVWFETKDLGTKVYRYANSLSELGFATFTVPPFPFRICYKNQPRWVNGTANTRQKNYKEPEDLIPNIYKVNETSYFWNSSSTMFEGDYAAIWVATSGTTPTGGLPNRVPLSAYPGSGDNVKLVPAGYPCTYEKTTSLDRNTSVLQYCGSNQVKLNGYWINEDCIREGASITARVGTNKRNPLVDTLGTSEGFPRSTTSSEKLIAFVRLPAVGSYDLCYSPKTYRDLVGRNVQKKLTDAYPLWFKLFQSTTTDGCDVSLAAYVNRRNCKPRQMRLTVTARTNLIQWATTDATAGSWGTIRIQSQTGILNSKMSYPWDRKGNFTKEFYSLSGGDTFRMVRVKYFTPSASSPGSLGTSGFTASGVTSTYGAESTLHSFGNTPPLGPNSESGCWTTADDIYGNEFNGNLNERGPTATNDLGADPAIEGSLIKNWWVGDLTAQRSVWAYIRYPPAGTSPDKMGENSWYMCYRQAGINNWRMIPRRTDSAVTGPAYLTTVSRANFSYTVNDTRADTWGQFAVTNIFKVLHTMPNTVGYSSIFKMVRKNQECWSTDGIPGTVDRDAGLQECEVGMCARVNCHLLPQCKGSADDSTTLRHTVYFHIRIPPMVDPVSDWYRVCFRYDLNNWIELPNRKWGSALLRHRYKFRPTTPPKLYYYLGDQRENSWARILIRRRDFYKYSPSDRLDVRPRDPSGRGTVLRLIRNVTSGKVAINCDIVWGLPSNIQAHDPTLTVMDLGVYCINNTGNHAASCSYSRIRPQNGGIIGTYPYIDVDSTSDDWNVEGAVAFIKLPTGVLTNNPRRRSGFKVCLKQMGTDTNWVELKPGPISVTPSVDYWADVSHYPEVVAGSYGYVRIVANNTNPGINLNTTIVKLVLNTSGECDRAAAGTQSWSNQYISQTYARSKGGRVVDATNFNNTFGWVGAVAAFMVFPTLSAGVDVLTPYKVCIANNDTNSNWYQAGIINVRSYGIQYTTYFGDQPPTNGAYLRVLFSTTSPLVKMNTMADGDSAKLIPLDVPCVGFYDVLPYGVNLTSTHVGIELSDDFTLTTNVTRSLEMRSRGQTNLGPGDELKAVGSTLSMILPRSTKLERYKVCYKLLNGPWMEVEAKANNPTGVFSGLYTQYSKLLSFSMDSSIFAQAPSSALSLYMQRFAYTSLVLSGVGTFTDPVAFDAKATSNPSYAIYVQGETGAITVYDTLKFVLIERETSPGVWKEEPSADCDSSYPTYTPTTMQSTEKSFFALHMPTTPGRYLVCYRQRGSGPWNVVAPSAAPAANPFYLIDSLLRVKATGSTIGVVDNFRVDDVTKGSVAIGDRVYLVNLNSVCGKDSYYAYNATTPVVAASVLAPLTGALGAFPSLYTAPKPSANYPWYPINSTYTLSYKLCYYKSWGNVTAGTTSTNLPFAKNGVWYLLPDLVTSAKPTSLFVTCPKITNRTFPIKAGTTLSYKVQVIDDYGNAMLLSNENPYEIRAVPTNFVLKNTGGLCKLTNSTDYGLAVSNDRQYTTPDGSIEFLVTPVSKCALGTCSISFQSTSDQLKTSNSCPINIFNGTVASLEYIKTSSQCYMDMSCYFSVMIYNADGTVAYASNEVATVSFSQHSGLGYRVNRKTVDASSSYNLETFSQGRFDFEVICFGAIPSAFLSNYTVSVTVSVNGKLTTTKFSIFKPILAQVNIVDVLPVGWDGQPADDNVVNFVPKWEPLSTYLSSYWKPAPRLSSLGTNPFYLQAEQYYRVVLEAYDQYGNIFTNMNYLTASERAITIEFDTGNSQNKIIGLPSDADGLEYFEGQFPTTNFADPRTNVHFRLKNSIGCTRTTGCRLVFKFGGADPTLSQTVLETPVRPAASAMKVLCGAGGQSPPYTLSTQCPVSSVETGFTVQITAVDQFGMTDEFNNGLVWAIMKFGNGVKDENGIGVTSVSKLLQNDVTVLAPITMSRGVGVITDLTTTAPCPPSNCSIHFVSNWGGMIAELALPVRASTTKLDCQVDSAQRLYSLSTDRTKVTSVFDVSRSENIPLALIYPGQTVVCLQVRASNPSGVRTMYETNWVTMFMDTKSPGVTINTVSTSPGRVKPLVRSRAQFCFIVAGPEGATFDIRFVAQRFEDPTYWTRTAGTCTLSGFTITTKKLIAGLNITKVTGLNNEMPNNKAPSSNVWMYHSLTQARDELAVSVSFALRDHYGVTIPIDQLNTAHKGMFVTVSRCTPANVNSKVCAPGTGILSDAAIYVSSQFSAAESGVLSMSIQNYQNKLDSTPSFDFKVTGWCLSCSVTFYVATEGSNYVDDVLQEIKAVLTMSVLLPLDSPKYVVFQAGTSPIRPASNDFSGLTKATWRYWPKPDASNLSPVYPTTKPILFSQDCMNLTLCRHSESLYLVSGCDESGSVDVLSFNVYVVSALEAPIYGESSCNPLCNTGSSTLISQVDIFNGYSLSASIGKQILECLTTGCIDSLTTKVRLDLPAVGATIEKALLALTSIPVAKFQVRGMVASKFYGSTDKGPRDTPSMKGFLQVDSAPLNIDSKTTITTLSLETIGTGNFITKYELIWRGSQKVKTLTFLDRAKEGKCVFSSADSKVSFTQTTKSTAAEYTGYKTSGSFDTLSVNYTKFIIPIETYIPITVDLIDNSLVKVVGAKGSITLTKPRWEGCNNGGLMTVQGGATQTFEQGRVTFWVKFSAPCEACYLKAVVAPDYSQEEYAGISPDDPALTAWSKKLVIRGDPVATNVYATSDYTKQSNTITVDDVISLTLQPVIELDDFTLDHSSANIVATAYNRIQNYETMEFNGNGGILRSTKTQLNLNDRHSVTVTGRGQVVLTFAFQRTCASCTVVVVWSLPDRGIKGTFLVRNSQGTTFVVKGSTSQAMLVGWQPRAVLRNEYFAAALWNMATSPNFRGPVGTVSDRIVGSPVQKVIINPKNGDGGDLVSTNLVVPDSTIQSSSVAWRLRATLPCYECEIRFNAGAFFRMTIMTTATRLVVTSFSPKQVKANQPTFVSMYASDELGYMDIRIGGITICRFNMRFQCTAATTNLVMTPSGDGVTPFGFTPAKSFFHMGGSPLGTGWTFTTQDSFVIVNGETPAGGLMVSFTGPARGVRPIFKEFFTGLTTNGTDVFVDVELETANNLLSLSVSDPSTDAFLFTELILLVGFVGKTTQFTPSLVSTHGDNKVTVSFAGDCQYDATATTISTKMDRGVATFRFVFTKETTSVMCRLSFYADPTSGSVKCVGSTCFTQSEVKIVGVVASGWDWSRPTRFDSVGISAPLYAVQGRKMYVEAQLVLSDPTTGKVSVARRCNAARTTCTFSVVPQSCSPAPIVTPASAKFDDFGKAAITLEWRSVSGGLPYTCSLATRITGATLEGPVGLTTTTATVCTPAKVVLVTNITRHPAWTAAGVLSSGKAYPLVFQMFDAQGVRCVGDTQDDATTLTVDLLAGNGIGTSFSGVKVFNTNVTQTTTTISPAPLLNTVRLLGGEFTFMLAFTGSTIKNKIPGVIVRVKVQSTNPPISQTIMTTTVDVDTFAQRVRVAPWTRMPRYIMKTSPIQMLVQVVDGVKDEWEPISGPPTVISNRPVTVQWRVQPTLPHQQPFTFSDGAVIADIGNSGEKNFTMNWNFFDGTYTIYVEDVSGRLNRSATYLFTAQTAVTFALSTRNFRVNIADYCTASPCALPNGTFSQGVVQYLGSNLLVNNITTSSMVGFNFSIQDSSGTFVRADNLSIILVRLVPLINDTSSTVKMALPPTMLQTGPRLVQMREGTLEIVTGLVGSTRMANGTHNPVVFEFSCSPQSKATCGDMAPIQTEPFIVESPIISSAVTQSYSTLRPVVKIPTSLKSLNDFDSSAFATTMAAYLQSNGASYVNSDNAKDILKVTACEVLRKVFVNADLRDTVCGVNQICTVVADSKCPPGVLRCNCPTSKKLFQHLQALHRNLLQTTPNTTTSSPTTAPEVQIEVSVMLENAIAFKGTTVDAISNEFNKLSTIMVQGLTTSSSFSNFQIQTDLVTNTTASAPVVTALPTSAPTAPPVTDTPSPPQTDLVMGGAVGGYSGRLNVIFMLVSWTMLIWVLMG